MYAKLLLHLYDLEAPLVLIVHPSMIYLQSKYKFSLSGCLFVCLYVCLVPINLMTAEPIRPKFCVEPHVVPGKAYEWSKFQIFASHQNLIFITFLKILKSTKFFIRSANLFLFCFTMYTKSMFTIKIEDGRGTP